LLTPDGEPFAPWLGSALPAVPPDREPVRSAWVGPGEPEGPGSAERAPALVGLTLDDPIFHDPRADAWVHLPPGIPVPTYPIVINPPVEALIDYFTARERDRFQLWVTRSGRYLTMIRRIFREHGLPEELAYTAMIESGFSPRAVSRVGAKGMWQFMEATAKRYGLVVNRWIDERLDPVKATVAAARYLGDLYGMFGHWFLAQAAYNAGEARVGRAIQRARTSDFWALTQTRHLPDETKLFVPQILAATVISREPVRFGFDATTEPPLTYDEVVLRRTMDFETIAVLAGISIEVIRDLNPALVAAITPPFGTYTLRLPVGVGERFETALREAPPGRVPTWGIHRVTRNQTLAGIARQYGVTTRRLTEVNRLPGGRLRGVSELVVPVSNRPPAPTVVARAPDRSIPAAGSGTAASREVLVQRGDTLWSIANRHGLRPETLARLNGMAPGDILPAGSRLKIAAP
jgi:membrane-bound lytic murein transglycosylase D